MLDANNNIVGFNETVPDSQPPHFFQSQNRLSDQRQQHFGSALQLREEPAHCRRVAVSRCLRARTILQNSEQSIQFTETAIINKTIVNETRFQFEHSSKRAGCGQLDSDDRSAGSFYGWRISGGPGAQHNDQWELTNNTSFSIGNHALKTGARVRSIQYRSVFTAEFRRHLHILRRRSGPELDANDDPIPGTEE